MTRKPNLPLQLGLAIFLLLLLAAAAGAIIGPSRAYDLASAFQGPSGAHWLGCDAFGSDLGRQLLAGSWHALWIGLVVTALNMFTGLVIGTVAGLAPYWLDEAIARVIDLTLAFPGLLLAIFLTAMMPRSEGTVIFALALTGWTTRARFCRSLVRQIASEPYVEAAIASGAGHARVVLRHIWPALGGQLLVQSALSLGYVILAEASLSFLGLGGATENPSWGRLIAEGREYMVEAPHLSIIPGLVFLTAVIACNLIAEGLRRRFNVKETG